MNTGAEAARTVDAYVDELLAPEPAPTPAMPAPVQPRIEPTVVAANAGIADARPAQPAVAMPAVATPPAPAPERNDAPLAPPGRWLRLSIDGDHYAIELLRVQEVVRLAPVMAVRGAAPAVLGVMNLRGRIVPVFDFGRWLDAGAVRADEQSRIVVVERDDELLGLLVSRVDDVFTLDAAGVEPPYDAGPRRRRAMDRALLGIARPGRVPTVLLDAGALFE